MLLAARCRGYDARRQRNCAPNHSDARRPATGAVSGDVRVHCRDCDDGVTRDRHRRCCYRWRHCRHDCGADADDGAGEGRSDGHRCSCGDASAVVEGGWPERWERAQKQAARSDQPPTTADRDDSRRPEEEAKEARKGDDRSAPRTKVDPKIRLREADGKRK